MTEESSTNEVEEIFKSLSLSAILVAAIQTLGEIRVDAKLFMNMAKEDRELKVDLIDGQTFVFTLKEKDGSGNNENNLITDFE
jgi:hypothetical protein